jgi:HAD superfamily hydrolase (TIGR01509 family)
MQAVVFDLDGVLIDSEHLWDEARRAVAAAHGGTWLDDATTAMQGMSSPEWSVYLRDRVGVALPAPQIVELVVRDLLGRYRRHLPLLPGAVDAVRRLAARWPLGLASSANRVVLDAVLADAGLDDAFAARVSSEEVPRGKPAPDVYVEAARRLGVPPHECVAVEDSTNGLLSALAAGLRVVAIPNRQYPPDPVAVSQAHAVIDAVAELTPEVVERAAGPGEWA